MSFLTEFDLDTFKEQERQEGEARGVKKANERDARDMLRKNLPVSLIHEISKLSEEAILKIAKKIGVSIS